MTIIEVIYEILIYVGMMSILTHGEYFEKEINLNGTVHIDLICYEDKHLKIINMSLKSQYDDQCREHQDSCYPSSDKMLLRSSCDEQRNCSKNFQLSDYCNFTDEAYYSGTITCGDQKRPFNCKIASEKIKTRCQCSVTVYKAWLTSSYPKQCLQSEHDNFNFVNNMVCLPQDNHMNSIGISEKLKADTSCFQVPKILNITYLCYEVPHTTQDNITGSLTRESTTAIRFVPTISEENTTESMSSQINEIVTGTVIAGAVMLIIGIIFILVVCVNAIVKRRAVNNRLASKKTYPNREYVEGVESRKNNRFKELPFWNEGNQEIDMPITTGPSDTPKTTAIQEHNHGLEQEHMNCGYSLAKPICTMTPSRYSLAKPLSETSGVHDQMSDMNEYDELSECTKNVKHSYDESPCGATAIYDRIADDTYDKATRKGVHDKDSTYDHI